MTPLHLMTRQTFLGWLFLLVGLVLMALAVSPVVIGLLSTPRAHGDVSIAFLGIGVVVALFGAWLLPSSGAPAAVQQIVTIAGPYIPRIGGQRAGDPPSPAPPPAPPTKTRPEAP